MHPPQNEPLCIGLKSLLSGGLQRQILGCRPASPVCPGVLLGAFRQGAIFLSSLEEGRCLRCMGPLAAKEISAFPFGWGRRWRRGRRILKIPLWSQEHPCCQIFLQIVFSHAWLDFARAAVYYRPFYGVSHRSGHLFFLFVEDNGGLPCISVRRFFCWILEYLIKINNISILKI